MKFTGKYGSEALIITAVLLLPFLLGAWHMALSVFIGYAAAIGTASTIADLITSQGSSTVYVAEVVTEWMGKSFLAFLVGGIAFVAGLILF